MSKRRCPYIDDEAECSESDSETSSESEKEKEHRPEKEKTPVAQPPVKKFRLSAKKFLNTYPHCDMTLEAALDSVSMHAGEPSEYIVAKELHKVAIVTASDLLKCDTVDDERTCLVTAFSNNFFSVWK